MIICNLGYMNYFFFFSKYFYKSINRNNLSYLININIFRIEFFGYFLNNIVSLFSFFIICCCNSYGFIIININFNIGFFSNIFNSFIIRFDD